MSHFDLDDSDNSIIHQDSDDNEIERDEDVDIGFRKHQFQTFQNGQTKRRHKEENLYGVFYQEPQKAKRFKADQVPTFVAASKRDSSNVNRDKIKLKNDFVSATRTTMESNKVPATVGGRNGNAGAEQESEDEAKIGEEQKAADDYFMSLLNRGRAKEGSRLPRDKEGSGKQKSDDETSFETSGLGGESGLGMISSFGSMNDTAPCKKPKMQSNVGKWEKHTKGIGSKLLSKMGWSGEGGLGSNRRKLKKGPDDNAAKTETVELEKGRKGISRPIEVVVRPSSLGLGFGNFKEASQLKTNRQIEAEVRGLEGKTVDGYKLDDDSKVTVWGARTRSSAIPGADAVLAQKQWRRKRKPAPRKVTIIPYEDLIAREATEDDEMQIIDMTGQGPGEKEAATQGVEVQLGAEILHNISFLVNTHETKLHSSSHFLQSIRRKCDSFQSDVEEMTKRQKEGGKQTEKLNCILLVVSQVEALTKKIANDVCSSSQILKDAMSLLEGLAKKISDEEKDSLQFWNTLSPAILSPLIQIQLDGWNPLQPIEKSKDVVDMTFGLVQQEGANVDPGRVALRDSIVLNQLLPKVKNAVDSTRWIASRHADLTLDLYEYILKKAIEAPSNCRIQVRDPSPTSVFPVGDRGEEDNLLAARVKRIFIFESIHANLQRSIDLWKPIFRRTNDGLELVDRLDLWIIPWLQHLDYPTVLPNIIAECRRKIKHAIETLLQKSNSDREFLSTAMVILGPWRNIFNGNDVQRMVSNTITPRLARYLSKQNLDFGSMKDCAAIFGIAFEMHQGGMISDINFLSIIEGEVLIRWGASMRNSLLSSCNITQCAQRYTMWKRLLLTKNGQELVGLNHSGKSLELLQDDESICHIFWSVSWMLQLGYNAETEKLRMVSFPTTNFQVVAARRARDNKRKNDDEPKLKGKSVPVSLLETNARRRRDNVYTPAFREVVEDFAKNEGIPFQPTNTMKDGRQVFTLGKASIYIEGDVIYELKGKEWLPVPLDKLATC